MANSICLGRAKDQVECEEHVHPPTFQHAVALDFLDSDSILDGFLFREYILIVFLVHVQFWCPQNPVEMSSKIYAQVVWKKDFCLSQSLNNFTGCLLALPLPSDPVRLCPVGEGTVHTGVTIVS